MANMERLKLRLFSKKLRPALRFALLALLVVSCGPAATDDGVTTEEAASAGSLAPPPMSPGLHTFSIESGGIGRSYLLYVPTGYQGAAQLPLVLVLHGGGGSAMSMVNSTGLNAK